MSFVRRLPLQGYFSPGTYRYDAPPWLPACDEYSDCLCNQIMDATYVDDEAILVQASSNELMDRDSQGT